MITKDGFHSWLIQQIEGTDVTMDRVTEVRFTTDSVYKEPYVCAEVLVHCLNDDGKKYIAFGDVATEIHVVPIKSLT